MAIRVKHSLLGLGRRRRRRHNPPNEREEGTFPQHNPFFSSPSPICMVMFLPFLRLLLPPVLRREEGGRKERGVEFYRPFSPLLFFFSLSARVVGPETKRRKCCPVTHSFFFPPLFTPTFDFVLLFRRICHASPGRPLLSFLSASVREMQRCYYHFHIVPPPPPLPTAAAVPGPVLSRIRYCRSYVCGRWCLPENSPMK